MRWKLFLPLALVLTLAALGGNYLWAQYTGNIHAAAITGETLESASLNKNILTLTVASGASLEDVVNILEQTADPVLQSVDDIIIEGQKGSDIPRSLRHEIELIIAQTKVTKEYYTSRRLLDELAAIHGYEAKSLIWGDWLLLEVSSSNAVYFNRLRLDSGVRP